VSSFAHAHAARAAARHAVLDQAMATSRDSEGFLTLGGARLSDLASDARIGTPAYVYDLDAIAAEARALRLAFDGAAHLIAYAVERSRGRGAGRTS
jgi:hypothetical protein